MNNEIDTACNSKVKVRSVGRVRSIILDSLKATKALTQLGNNKDYLVSKMD